MYTTRIYLFVFLTVTNLGVKVFGQDELQEAETFRTYQLINGHSVRTIWKNNLDFTITHRFTESITSGASQFWGMDSYSNIRLGLAYGITDRLTVTIGRTRLNKIYDGQVKYRLVTQNGSFPLTVTLVGITGLDSDEFKDGQEDFLNFNSRLAYSSQLLVAREFNDWFSLQLAPTVYHNNLALNYGEQNTGFALGSAVQFNLSSGFSIVGEYYFNQFTGNDSYQPEDVVGIGFDFTSVRHSFQLQITNAIHTLPQEILSQTTQNFFSSDGLFFGFHIARKFQL